MSEFYTVNQSLSDPSSKQTRVDSVCLIRALVVSRVESERLWLCRSWW